MTIKEIKESFMRVHEIQDPLFDLYKDDERKGVQIIIKQTKKRLAHQQELKDAFAKRFNIEREFWNQGLNQIAGIDEVGRGPLAGPVVAAAVILPHDFKLLEVNDSKQLTDKKRRELVNVIKEKAISYAYAVIDNHVIDDVNIYQATRIAMKQAVLSLTVQPQQLMIDAMDVDMDIPQLKLIKGDAKSNSIAAASILAKVTRDDLMIKYNQQYPEYDFCHNDGYGTKKHLEALKKYGATPIHRKTFAPVRDLTKN
ncbi:ribonuclease HII [Fructilactobacillus sp. Tb1]|uniref:ribonuclease HII n=1 Tax=Fructilactobacillus sp. Tb1 TaxID=3422304 RepID=UPI003D283789